MSHDHERATAPSDSLPLSVLAQSAGGRLVGVVIVLVCLWLLIWWAVVLP